MGDSVTLINCFEDLLKQNKNLIDVIGDCPNIERPIAPEAFLWKQIAKKGGYRCQMNLVTGKFRIVSPQSTRIANGSKNAMLEKMNRLASTDFFQRGDVIGVYRNGLYEHYGIYLGNGRVIHYCGEGDDFRGRVIIHEAPFSEFLKNSKNCFVVWFDEGRLVRLQPATIFYSLVPVLIMKMQNIGRNARFTQRKKPFVVQGSVWVKNNIILLPIIASILRCGVRPENPSPVR